MNLITASLYIVVIQTECAAYKVDVSDLVYVKGSSLRELLLIARKQFLHQLKAFLEHDVWLLVLRNT